MDNTSENLQVQLREQIQFYFSPQNLLTDFQLQKTIKKSKNHWLPLTYLLNCNKVREILEKLNVELKNRKKCVYKLLQHSNVLKVRKYRVKSKVKFNTARQRKKLIYIQLQNNEATLKLQNQLNELEQEQRFKMNIKKGNKWLFLLLDNEQKKTELERYLRIKGSEFSVSKIINGQQWKQKIQAYEKLIQKIKKLKKPTMQRADEKRMEQV